MGRQSTVRYARSARPMPHVPNAVIPPRPDVKISSHSFEAIVEYVLEAAAQLVSPPKDDGEDNEFRCEDVAAAIRGLKGVLCDMPETPFRSNRDD